MTKATNAKTSVQSQTEDVCPECRVNHVEPPFDYCSLCEMLSSYFREKLAAPEVLRDQQSFTAVYDKWRNGLTWAEMENLRDTYWTPRKRAQKRAGH